MNVSIRFAFALLLLLTACLPASEGTLITDTPHPTQSPLTSVPTERPSPEVPMTPTLSRHDVPPAGAKSEFRTDFSKHSVSYKEILSGGPPKDGIPALKAPRFVSVSEADEWLEPFEPVIQLQVGDDARAYPIQILIWHEIVNDVVGDEPIIVTFCPLCNTAIALKRTVDGNALSFGTTGRLRYSNLIMYDIQTETWWQQATGEAIAGELTGTYLEYYPAVIISWQDFKNAYPAGKVLSRDTGHVRDYGNNPYFGYDDVRNSSPFLYKGPPTPKEMPPLARILTIDLKGEAVAYPYETLEQVGVVNDTVGGEMIVVFWQPGTVSPLANSTTSNGREVGTAASYSRMIDAQPFSFSFVEGKILDDQTKSEWNILGEAIAGEMNGEQLNPVISINHFWFSWAAFKPETRIYEP